MRRAVLRSLTYESTIVVQIELSVVQVGFSSGIEVRAGVGLDELSASHALPARIRNSNCSKFENLAL